MRVVEKLTKRTCSRILAPLFKLKLRGYDQKDKAVLEPLAASQKSTCRGGGWC